jgi:hypothetical protein
MENPLIFYPRVWTEMLVKQFKWISLYTRMRLIYNRVKRDPARLEYMDLALEPVTDHEEERELFQSSAAQNYLEKVHEIDRASRGEFV